MKKVFWEDPYQCQLMTKVSSVNINRILFEETIAFSFSGGQESDKAYVNELAIINSVIEGNLIYYLLPESHGLAVGDEVTMKID